MQKCDERHSSIKQAITVNKGIESNYNFTPAGGRLLIERKPVSVQEVKKWF